MIMNDEQQIRIRKEGPCVSWYYTCVDQAQNSDNLLDMKLHKMDGLHDVKWDD
jgi:hypothetical protein